MNKYKIGAESSFKLLIEDILSIALDCEKENLDKVSYLGGVTTLDALKKNSLIFLDQYSDEALEIINTSIESDLLFILPEIFKNKTNKPVILNKNPRHIYSLIVNKLFKYDTHYWVQKERISKTSSIHKETEIMSNVFVGANTKIGKNSIVFPNTVIGPNCNIGENVIIKSNTVIGQAGFGIYKDLKGLNQHLPHVGAVIIEDNVEIGALNTVVAGTIHPTVVESYVKTDDHVHIAHNDYISKGVQIAAHALLSGSVFVGENAWLGPNITVIDHVAIGKESFIGSGTNIVKEVGEGTTVVGNPGKKIR
tara:strand:+ start:143 stop:1066 length:924 start_codon:yes stop_codon:yes gene_type:complete